MARQAGRSLPRASNLLEVSPARIRLGRLAESELGEAEYGGQDIVEVVSDSARQPADGLHLLRLTKLFFALPKRRLRAPALQDRRGEADRSRGADTHESLQ